MEKEMLKQVLEEILKELRAINERDERKGSSLSDLVQKVVDFDQKLDNVKFQVAAPNIKYIELLLSAHLSVVEDKISSTSQQLSQFESRHLFQGKQILKKGWLILTGFAVLELVILLVILIK